MKNVNINKNFKQEINGENYFKEIKPMIEILNSVKMDTLIVLGVNEEYKKHLYTAIGDKLSIIANIILLIESAKESGILNDKDLSILIKLIKKEILKNEK